MRDSFFAQFLKEENKQDFLQEQEIGFSMRVVPRISFERFAPEYESIPGLFILKAYLSPGLQEMQGF